MSPMVQSVLQLVSYSSQEPSSCPASVQLLMLKVTSVGAEVQSLVSSTTQKLSSLPSSIVGSNPGPVNIMVFKSASEYQIKVAVVSSFIVKEVPAQVSIRGSIPGGLLIADTS